VLPIPGSALVYFRADCITGLYPATASEVFSFSSQQKCPPVGDAPSLPYRRFLVRQSLEEFSESQVYEIDNADRVWAVMQELFQHFQLFPARRVYSIHSNSVLAVLARWWAAKSGSVLPTALQRSSLVDVPEAVLAPSVLSLSKRNSFNIEEYVRILGVQPDEGLDYETGVLANLIKIYG
jgi:hypothetical protein